MEMCVTSEIAVNGYKTIFRKFYKLEILNILSRDGNIYVELAGCRVNMEISVEKRRN